MKSTRCDPSNLVLLEQYYSRRVAVVLIQVLEQFMGIHILVVTLHKVMAKVCQEFLLEDTVHEVVCHVEQSLFFGSESCWVILHIKDLVCVVGYHHSLGPGEPTVPFLIYLELMIVVGIKFDALLKPASQRKCT